jgi:uncharacterized damage-inducible protein DinB
MNTLVKEQSDLLQQTQALRYQLMDILTDEDLAYKLPGQNPILGALCREMGDIQHAYIESFKTFKQDFSYRNNEPGLEASVEKLAAWLKALDDELLAVLSGLSDLEIQTQTIDRGFAQLPITVQFHIYREALLIFYGKASVYLKALEKPMPDQWQQWIG